MNRFVMIFLFSLSIVALCFPQTVAAQEKPVVTPDPECICQTKTQQEHYDEADAVFTGESLVATEKTTKGIWNTLSVENVEKADEHSKMLIESFEVNGMQKAKVIQKISECNFSFAEGKRYRIYATYTASANGTPYFTTNICSGTKEIILGEEAVQNEQSPASGDQEAPVPEQDKKEMTEGQDAQKN